MPISLEELVGSRYIVVVIRFPVNGQWMELAGLVDISRTLYFMKPDFIKSSKDPETGKKTGKSRRLIKFPRGWVKLYLRVTRLNSKGEHHEEKIKLLELEVRWIGHTYPSHAVASNYREMRRIERKLGKLNDEHLFAKLKYTLQIRGQTQQGIIVKNIVPPVKRTLQFGHQVIKVEDGPGFSVPGERVHEGSVFKLEPFNHTVRGEIIVRNKNDLDKHRFEPTLFTVYRLEEGWVVHYIVKPRQEIGRIVVESGHHWNEGYGRILVELRNQVLVFSHSRPVYIEVFEIPE